MVLGLHKHLPPILPSHILLLPPLNYSKSLSWRSWSAVEFPLSKGDVCVIPPSTPAYLFMVEASVSSMTIIAVFLNPTTSIYQPCPIAFIRRSWSWLTSTISSERKNCLLSEIPYIVQSVIRLTISCSKLLASFSVLRPLEDPFHGFYHHSQGFATILMVVDHFIKMGHFIPFKDPNYQGDCQSVSPSSFPDV